MEGRDFSRNDHDEADLDADDTAFDHFTCTPDTCEDDEPDCPKRGRNRCLKCGGPTLPEEDFCNEYCAMKYASDHGIPYIDEQQIGWES